MNNICIFIPSLHSGGAEKQAVLLTKALKYTHNANLVVWNGHLAEAKFLAFINEHKIKTVFLTGNLLVRFLKLIKFLKSQKINFIFAFLASTNFYGSLAGKIAGVNYIIGGIRNSEIPHYKLILQKFLHNHLLNYTIFNNYSGKNNLIKEGFKSSSCYVIPNCFELEILPILRSQKKTVTIVSLARFVEQKDYPTAIKAISYLVNVLLKGNHSLISYQIIGYGILEHEIRSLIKENKLEEVIEVIINPPNIPQLLKDSDIFLTTSLFEGTSNSIMEAMGMSLPVVATDAGDNNQLVAENNSGYLCQLRDYKHIAERLHTLIIYPKKRITFGEAGYQKLKTEFSMEKFKERYIEFINKVGNSKPV